MKKRPFLLIEVLIAMTVIALCITPLISFGIRDYSNQKKALENLELERLANWTWSEIVIDFLKSKISWKDLPDLHKKSDLFSLSDITLSIPGMKDKTIKRSFKMYAKGQKTGEEDGKEYKLLYVTLFLNDRPFEFRIPVQKNE